MRDENRIQPFCNELAELWKKLPDWRFMQLICNIKWERDPFFMEDTEILENIEKCVKEYIGE